MPSFGLYFASYDWFKHALAEKQDVNVAASSILAGGLSGSLTWLCIYPIDVAKTKIQTLPLDVEVGKRRFVGVVRELVRTEGVGSLFRGLGVTLVRAFPVNAVIFPIFEICLYACQTPRDEWRMGDIFGEE